MARATNRRTHHKFRWKISTMSISDKNLSKIRNEESKTTKQIKTVQKKGKQACERVLDFEWKLIENCRLDPSDVCCRFCSRRLISTLFRFYLRYERHDRKLYIFFLLFVVIVHWFERSGGKRHWWGNAERKCNAVDEWCDVFEQQSGGDGDGTTQLRSRMRAINKENKTVSFVFFIRAFCVRSKFSFPCFLNRTLMRASSHTAPPLPLRLAMLHCFASATQTHEHKHVGEKTTLFFPLALIFSYIFTIVCFSRPLYLSRTANAICFFFFFIMFLFICCCYIFCSISLNPFSLFSSIFMLRTTKWICRCWMGLVQHRHISVHPMCWRSSIDGRTHIKSETLENGPMGRLGIGAHERGWQLQSTSQIRATRTRLLPTSMRRWSTVSRKKNLINYRKITLSTSDDDEDEWK